MTAHIFTGDCRTILPQFPSDRVHCCVTSPPYFGLRDYGHGDQIGLEACPDDYVTKLVEVFREVRRVLRPDGTLWLNLGDSYARAPAKGGSGPNGKNEDRWGYGEAKSRVKDANSKQATNSHADLDGLARSAKVGSSDGAVGPTDRPGTRARAFRPGSGRADGVVDERGQRNRNGVGPVPGLKEKDLIGIPWRVAFALQADGWYLRQDIIWHKPNPMPESVQDRCTKAHEYIFLLSKSYRYYFDAQAIAEPLKRPEEGKRKTPAKFGGANKHVEAGKQSRLHSGNDYIGTPTGTRNRRSVWTVTTKPYKEAHFATFPCDLIEPCILAGSPAGGLVLDPFGGAGTTALVAEKHGRTALSIELNPAYVELQRKRLNSTPAP